MKSFAFLFHTESGGLPLLPQRRFDLRGRKVQQWLNQLPLADAAGCARQVLVTLADMGAAQHDGNDLLTALEMLRPTVMDMSHALTTRLQGICPPLSTTSRTTLELAAGLEHRIACCYQRVLKNLYLHGAPKNSKHAALAAQRVLRHKSRELLLYYGIYAQAPEKLWRAMHDCYRFSEQHQLLNVTIHDRALQSQPNCTILQTYLQIVATVLANPFCLLQGEIHKLYMVMESWVDHISIHGYQATVQNGQYFIDMQQDAAAAVHSQRVNALHARVVDCRALVRKVEKDLLSGQFHFNYGTGGQKSMILAEHFLHRLYVTWGQRRQRRFSRTRCSDDAQLTIGLEPVNSRPAPTQPQQQQPSWTLAPLGAGALGGEPANPLFDTANEAVTGSHATEQHPNWLKVEESAGGCRMLWQYAHSTKARVGDVVVFSSAKTQRPVVGVIRWLQQVENYGLLMGLQLLAPFGGTVAIKGDSQRRISGLILPALRNLGQAQTLVLPADIDGTKPWRIELRHSAFTARLQQTIENTGLICIKEFLNLNSGDLDFDETATCRDQVVD